MYHWRLEQIKRKIQSKEGEEPGAGGGAGGGAGSGGGAGGEANEWVNTLPENVRDWDEVKNAENPDAFWNNMSDMRSHLGRSIRIPSKEAGEEDWSAFNSKLTEAVPNLIRKPDLENPEEASQFYGSLGRPETHEDYPVPEVEGLDLSLISNAREAAHNLGITTRQFEGLSEYFVNNGKAQAGAMLEAKKTEYATLNTEWGEAYDKNIDIVGNFLEQSNAPEDMKKIFKDQNMNAESHKWFLELAKMIQGEGTHLSGQGSGQDMVLTPEEATMRISEIMNNKDHPYWNPSDPAHDTAKKEIRRLHVLKLGEKGKTQV